MIKILFRHDGTEQTIYEKPLDWQKAGLSQTATGYGQKLTTPYVTKNKAGRVVRVYQTCFSNSPSTWFYENGQQVFIN